MQNFGKIFKIMPVMSGKNAEGREWISQTIVVETFGDRPAKLAFELYGEDKVALCKNLKVGDMVEIGWAIESHEYNDKWFTKLRAYYILPYGKLTVD